jgi:hypothetical protein
MCQNIKLQLSLCKTKAVRESGERAPHILNLGRLAARATIFCTVGPNTIFLYIRKCLSARVYQRQVSDKTEVRTSLQNCDFSARNLLHVIHLMPRIWRRLRDFWKTRGSLICRWLTGENKNPLPPTTFETIFLASPGHSLVTTPKYLFEAS